MLSNPFASFKKSSTSSTTTTIQRTIPNDDKAEIDDNIKKFTLKEVSKHTSSEDLWMIIHNNVYDVTQLIYNHPGGAEVLFDCAGIDATLSFDDVGHSSDAVEMLQGCKLGTLTLEDQEFLININNIKNNNNSKDMNININSSLNGKVRTQQSTTTTTNFPQYNSTSDLSSSSSFSSASASSIYKQQPNPIYASTKKDINQINNNDNSSNKSRSITTLKKKKKKKLNSRKLKNSSNDDDDDDDENNNNNNKHQQHGLIEKFSVPALLCVSLSALALYLYLQRVKWDY